MRRFLPYFSLLKRYKWAFIAGLLFGAIHGIAGGFGLPFVTSKVFPVVFGDPPPTKWVLLGAVAILPAAMLVRGIAGFLNVYFISYCGIRLLRAIQLRVYAKMQALPLQFYQVNRGGDLLARMSGDTAVIQTILTSTANDLIKQPITFVGASVALVYLSIQRQQLVFVLFCIGIIPIILVPMRFVGRKLKSRAVQAQAQSGLVVSCIQENLSATKEIRAFNLQKIEVERFRQALDVYQKLQLKIVKYGNVLSPTVEFVGAVGTALAIFYAARARITLEDIIPLIVALYMTYEPFKKFGAIYNAFKQGVASLDRVEYILEDTAELPEPEHPEPVTKIDGEIEFAGVSFAYDEGPVLVDVDEKLAAGETVALVGPSGAGKTTFANLIPRLYDVKAGHVLVGGVDVRGFRKFDLRSRIAVVSQDPVLFNDSIMNNIRLGRQDASDEEVRAAAREAYAHEFIEEMPGAYDTTVGDRGARLSGGQRQRVAIARAFLRDAPILILDEATSALDSESEAMIQKALSKLVAGRTTIIIAHRFSTIKIAHRILVLEAGRIVARGSHDDLYRGNDLYRRLYDAQS